MKKKFKILLLVLMVLLIPTGCVKLEAGVKINKDGSMDYSFITALDKQYAENESLNKLDEDTIKEYKKKNIIIDNYEDDKYKGYRYSIHYENLDQLSSIAENDACTINITEKEVDNNYCFKKEKNLFSTTYKAKFSTNFADEQKKEASSQVDDKYTEQLLKSMDLKFKVELPVKPGKNNATTQDGNTLIWDMTDPSFKEVKTIEFEFDAPNTLVITIAIIVGIIILLLVIAIIISTIINRKNKPIKEEVKKDEIIELPQESNPVVNALLSPDGNDVNNLNK